MSMSVVLLVNLASLKSPPSVDTCTCISTGLLGFCSPNCIPAQHVLGGMAERSSGVEGEVKFGGTEMKRIDPNTITEKH